MGPRPSARPSRGGWTSTVAGLAVALAAAFAMPDVAHTAPGDAPTPSRARQGTDAPSPAQAAIDPARIVTQQIQSEKARNMTGMLSRGFKTDYDAVPRDEDNLGLTNLGGGNDVPDRVVKVSDLRLDDASDPRRASATVVVHCTNPDAPKPSFDRTLVVAFVKEDGQWRIDDVRMIDLEKAEKGRPAREIWLRRGYQALADQRNPPVATKADPACAGPAPASSQADPKAAAAGFKPLTDIAAHRDDPNRRTIAEKFVQAIGSTCPFAYQLVDLTGDGLTDLVLQLSDRKLGATDTGLRRTAVYALDRQGKWQPVIDGLSRTVLTRTDGSGDPEVALAGNAGEGYRSWRWAGTAFVANPPPTR